MQAMPPQINVGESPRVLLPRLSHIGDCILTLPVANAIKDRFPDSFIAWAIESPGDFLVKGCQAVDEVITIPKGWLKKPRQAWALRRQLRALNFDISIDPQSLTKSAGIGWVSGAKQRVGLTKPLGRELAPWLNNVNVSVDSKHLVDRSLEMLKVIGITNPAARFDLQIPKSATSFANEMAADSKLKSGFVVINPGAGWQSRQWSNKRFGAVASYLGSKYGLTSLISWFGDQEERMADEIVSSSDGHAVKAPSTRLWELAALIQRSRFFVGCDTGPSHLAGALSVPCITLFGTTEPSASAPYELDVANPIHIRIQKYYQSGSSRERRKAENAAMMEIQIDDVTSGVDQMMKQLSANAAA